ncbi:Hypothetical_protein [Hexamita inflata]|uniref:Hypothetical_protein n=1 Tax=Hexamita inflata TaxID=28002 RepID=A0ABP1KR91_9EUKA
MSLRKELLNYITDQTDDTSGKLDHVVIYSTNKTCQFNTLKLLRYQFHISFQNNPETCYLTLTGGFTGKYQIKLFQLIKKQQKQSNNLEVNYVITHSIQKVHQISIVQIAL